VRFPYTGEVYTKVYVAGELVLSFRVDQMPYSGMNGSVTGREGSRYAIEEITELLPMVINRTGWAE